MPNDRFDVAPFRQAYAALRALTKILKNAKSKEKELVRELGNTDPSSTEEDSTIVPDIMRVPTGLPTSVSRAQDCVYTAKYVYSITMTPSSMIHTGTCEPLFISSE